MGRFQSSQYPYCEFAMPPRLLHPFTKPAKEALNPLVRADGVRVYDRSGKDYIDAIGSLWFCQVGYGRREMVDAISAQLHELPVYNIFDPWTSDIAEAAAERVAAVSPLSDGRVFFCCSGSESVDTAFKISRLVAQLKGEPDRQIMLRRTRGYHGVNAGGTSLQGIAPNREGWGDMIPHVIEIDPDDIESAASVFAEHGPNIAGVISEPVQGAGGVWPPTDDYLRRLRQLCTTHGALMIADEVIAGFGRTGSWFASQTFDVTPDLMTFAKGVTSGYQPVGGVIVSRDVCDILEADPDFIFRHGYTYSGHPGGMAAVVTNIDIIENEGLVERANHLAERFSAGFEALKGDGLIEGYRGLGGIWSAQLGTEYEQTTAIRNHMLDSGVIARPVGDSIAFCPPLIISDEDIDQCIDVLQQGIKTA